MYAATTSPFDARMLRAYALPAVLIALGLQLIRVLFPSLAWYMMDVVGVPSLQLAPYALGAFLPAFLSPLLWRLLGQRRAVWLTSLGLLLSRAVEQLSALPEVDLWSSLIGTGFFAMFLPLWTAHLRAQRSIHSEIRWSGGIILGLTLDSAIKGLTNTLDLSWLTGPLPLITVGLMVVLGFALLQRETFPVGKPASDASWVDALPLLGLGPYLVLQANLFQNQGWIAEVAHVGPDLAFFLLMAGNALAALGTTWALASPRSFRPSTGLIAAALLIVIVAVVTPDTPLAALWLLIAQALTGWALGLIGSVTHVEKRTGIAATSLWLGIGLVLFVVLNFAYYAGLDIRIPIPRTILFPAAAGTLGLALLAASLRVQGVGRKPWTGRTLAYSAMILLTLPLLKSALGATQSEPPAQAAPNEPLTIMTYNIHSAFNAAGRQDPEAIARVIEASGADVVALQEVSRGWLIDGSTDLVGWLTGRLGMRAVFQGTSDPLWGNAILTRYPPTSTGQAALPRGEALIERGYIWIDVPWNGLRVIDTHFHHPDWAGPLRERQAASLIQDWAGRRRTVVLGDLNAEPGTPEIGALLQAGFEDAWSQNPAEDGFTYSSTAPVRRIDWILHTPDLNVRRVEILPTTASDHLPLMAELEPGE